MATRSTGSLTLLGVAVIGIGQMGTAFAFNRARVGTHDVTTVARPSSQRLAQLQSDGAIVNPEGQRF